MKMTMNQTIKSEVRLKDVVCEIITNRRFKVDSIKNIKKPIFYEEHDLDCLGLNF